MIESGPILVLDDNLADGNLIKRTLQRSLGEKWNIIHCSDPSAAFELISHTDLRCAMVDYRLGAVCGLEVAQRIQKTRPGLPVIMLTGEGNEQVAVEAMKLGMSDYLSKEALDEKTLKTAVIGALKRAELIASLESKQQELESFAYSAAHDIRSPVSTIHQLSGLIKKRFGDNLDPKAMEWLQAIEGLSGEVIDLVTQLLEYTKTGRTSNFEPVSLLELFTNIKERLKHLIDETHATIEMPEEDLILFGDPTGFLQIFQNLLANSLKFTRPNVPPHVKVRWKVTPGTEVAFLNVVSISDNGMGIEESNIERIFFPLVRVSRAIDGAGLGLSIVKRILEQHRGKISVKSKLGEGTTFTLRFPRLETEIPENTTSH